MDEHRQLILQDARRANGERVAIEFVDRLRGNVKFDSIDELIEQMHADVAASRPVLGCS